MNNRQPNKDEYPPNFFCKIGIKQGVVEVMQDPVRLNFKHSALPNKHNPRFCYSLHCSFERSTIENYFAECKREYDEKKSPSYFRGEFYLYCPITGILMARYDDYATPELLPDTALKNQIEKYLNKTEPQSAPKQSVADKDNSEENTDFPSSNSESEDSNDEKERIAQAKETITQIIINMGSPIMGRKPKSLNQAQNVPLDNYPTLKKI